MPSKFHLRQATISSNIIAMLRKIKCSNLKTRQESFWTLQRTAGRVRATFGISESQNICPSTWKQTSDLDWSGIILPTTQKANKNTCPLHITSFPKDFITKLWLYTSNVYQEVSLMSQTVTFQQHPKQNPHEYRINTINRQGNMLQVARKPARFTCEQGPVCATSTPGRIGRFSWFSVAEIPYWIYESTSMLFKR